MLESESQDALVVAMELTFAVAEVQLQDGLEERVRVEDKVKVRADLGLQRPLDPLVLWGRDTLDQGIWDLWTHKAEGGEAPPPSSST